MPNKRAVGKVMLGAMVAEELSDGVDEWCRRNYPKTRSLFVIEASREKLAGIGIKVDSHAVMRDGRSRIQHPDAKPVRYKTQRRSNSKMKAARGAIVSEVKKNASDAASEAPSK